MESLRCGAVGVCCNWGLWCSAAACASAAEIAADPAGGGWIAEVESTAPVDEWSLEKEHAGYSGSAYYACRGPQVKHLPGKTILGYRIKVPTSGGDQMTIRAHRDVEGARTTRTTNEPFHSLACPTLCRCSTALDGYRQGDGTIYAKVSPSGKKSEIGNEFSRFMIPQQPFITVRETGFHHYALLHLTKEGALKLDVFRLPDDRGEKSLVDSLTIEPRR